jgi:hypothetical protein
VTAPTVPAPRLLPWLLRVHRPALYAWTGLLVLLGGTLLWLWGPLTDAAAEAWRQYNACATGGVCLYDQDAILRYKDVYLYASFAVLAVPFLVAAWAGGALTGRELEHGTAQLAWSQGISPARWLAAKLAVPAALVGAGTGLLVLLHHLMWSAGRSRVDNTKSWFSTETFYANGPLVVALALAGLAAGALAGLLLRRSLAALGAAVAAVAALWTGLRFALPHLWPTVTGVSGLDGGPEYPGLLVDEGLVTATGAHIGNPGCGSTATAECRALFDRLDAVGYYTDYHPASHYWPLQLTATGAVLAAAALMTLIAFRLLRRRTAGKGAAR